MGGLSFFACGSSLPCGQAPHAAGEQPSKACFQSPLLGGRAPAAQVVSRCPATRNRTRDHLIAASFYSQRLYQLSYSRLARMSRALPVEASCPAGKPPTLPASSQTPTQPKQNKNTRNPKRPKSFLGGFCFLPAAAPCPAGKPPTPQASSQTPTQPKQKKKHTKSKTA